jgi:hypothetical protein
MNDRNIHYVKMRQWIGGEEKWTDWVHFYCTKEILHKLWNNISRKFEVRLIL